MAYCRAGKKDKTTVGWMVASSVLLSVASMGAPMAEQMAAWLAALTAGPLAGSMAGWKAEQWVAMTVESTAWTWVE